MSDLFDEWGVDDRWDDEEELDFDHDDAPGDDADDFGDGLGAGDEGDDDALSDGDPGEDDAFGDDLDFDEEDMGSALADTVDVSCPYCGAEVELGVDPLGGDTQEYVEDCEVCCQPLAVRLTLDPEGVASVDVGTLDEG